MARLSKFEGTDGAALTVSIVEDLTINSRDYGSKQSVAIPSIVDVTRRIVTITTTEATIATFSTAVGAGTYIAADVMYIRFSNLDLTNFVMLTFKHEDNTEFRVKLDAGKSFIFYGDNSGGLVDVMKANGSALGSGLADLYDITADADTADVDIEMYIASK